jgi:hypothetical protein
MTRVQITQGDSVTKYNLLRRLNLGSSIAEQEQGELTKYFVQTHLWTEVRNDRIDIILGDKGSGKSAIFLLLQADQVSMSVNSGTYLYPAENPRGDAAFKNLVDEPPADEKEIELVWRMYFLVLVTKFLESRRSDNKDYIDLYRVLVNAGLMESSWSLADILSSVRRFVSRIRKVGFSVSIDPNTLNPALSPAIELSADVDKYNEVTNNLGQLYRKAERALAAHSLTLWILIDRLDIAFERSHELEKNALRALLRTYSAMHAYAHIKLKIFLRSDLFERITVDGFRETSHIVPKSTELFWDRDGILDVIVRRALSNAPLVSYYKIDPEIVKKSFTHKEALFSRMFPKTIGIASTLEWILQNLTDGRGKYCPRDVIEFLNVLKEMQISAIERGFSEPAEEMLFSDSLFHEAFARVSDQKCKTVLYAEYPQEREFIDALKSTNHEFTVSGLAQLWARKEDEVVAIAQRLMRTGLFIKKPNLTRGNFQISSLYRPALDVEPGVYGN